MHAQSSLFDPLPDPFRPAPRSPSSVVPLTWELPCAIHGTEDCLADLPYYLPLQSTAQKRRRDREGTNQP